MIVLRHIWLGLAPGTLAAAEPSAKDGHFFKTRVKPVLPEHCGECHREKKQKGGLRLDSRAATIVATLAPSANSILCPVE